MTYPVNLASRVEQNDNYLSQDGHDVSVADPYRWLENPESPETKNWVAAENNITTEFLQQCDQREELKKRFNQVNDYKKIGIPTKYGDYYYFGYNSGLSN